MTQSLFPGRSFAAFLFDMDGTLLSSILAAERVWARWARKHGLDVDAFLPTIHGKRSVDTVRMADIAGVDPEAEAAWITSEEMLDVEGVHEIAGAKAVLAALPANALGRRHVGAAAARVAPPSKRPACPRRR